MTLNHTEQNFFLQYKMLKAKSGLHSPSIQDIQSRFPNIQVKIDACFLCNPFAFELVFDHLSLVNLKEAIQYYPPQNHTIADFISSYRDLDQRRLIVGNGAIEIIESLFKEIKGKMFFIPVPTFSAYYELAAINNDVYHYILDQSDDFSIDVGSLVKSIKKVKPDYIVLVNPSNPSGQLLSLEELRFIHKNISSDQMLIIDESFIDFAPDFCSFENDAKKLQNVIIIRSLSKDFGIAGLRLGYAFLPNDLKDRISSTGFLWNINGLAFAFCKLLQNANFIAEYNRIRTLYRNTRDEFFQLLQDITSVRVFSSEANFFLLETSFNPEHLFVKLLLNHGIYVRVLNDRIGLNGNFIRIACKTPEENKKIVETIQMELYEASLSDDCFPKV